MPAFEDFLIKNIKEDVIEAVPDVTISLLYSPYCGFCKKQMNAWDELSNKYKNKFIFDKVDCTKSNKCDIYKIEGVPAFIKHKDDEIISRSIGFKEINELDSFIND